MNTSLRRLALGFLVSLLICVGGIRVGGIRVGGIRVGGIRLVGRGVGGAEEGANPDQRADDANTAGGLRQVRRVEAPDPDVTHARRPAASGVARATAGTARPPDANETASTIGRGRDLAVVGGRIRASDGRDGRAEVSLPTRADEPFHVVDVASEVAIDAQLVGARPVEAVLSDGLVLYPQAHASGADVTHRITEDGTEDFLLLDGPTDVRYEVQLGAGVAAVRNVGGAVEFLDESGDPRLRMDPPVIVDAEGVMHAALATVSGCAVDTDPRAPWGRSHVAPGSRTCTIAISWDELPYPALLDPAWNATGNMIQDRYGHGMVTLPSGLVLAVGGSRSSGGSGMALTTCEVFNPASGTWAMGTPLPQYAFSASCFFVSSNTKVFCWNDYDTSWMYEIATATWAATGPMVASNRQGAAFAQLADGRVLFVSGSSPLLVTAEIFDPAGNGGLGTYTATTFPPARARAAGAAVLLADNRVIVAGGWNPTDMYMLQTEIFNPTLGSFIAGPNLTVGTSNGTAGVRLPTNRVLIQGGFGVTQIYNPAGPGSWAAAQDVPIAGSGPGRLGFVGTNTLLSVQPTRAYLFDTTLNTWTETSIQAPRSGSGGSTYHGSIAPIAGGRVLLSGGIDTTGLAASMRTTEILSLSVAGLGGSCTVSAECASGFCANGVCCSSACNAGCQLCNGSGTCGTAPSGTTSAACGQYVCQGAASCPTSCSSDAACLATDYCASDNTCKTRLPQGTMCAANDCRTPGCRFCASAGGCVDGYCCDGACNGACDNCAANFGTCSNVGGAGSPSCAPYLCSGVLASCPTTCSGDAQCASNAFCNTSNQCETKRAAGVTCSTSSSCQTGLTCVDSVCCTSTCSGQCQSCNRPGSLGSCVAVTGAPINRPACNGTSAPCAGSCNGASAACVYPTVSCRAASCAGGVETLPTSCNGNGSCPSATTGACSPYVCNASMTACETMVCATDSDCVSTHYCEGTSCMLRRSNGNGCSTGRECGSGTCEDSVCCNVACGGSTTDCQACSVLAGAASDGTCATVAPAAAHVCRAATGSCDVAEVCGGATTCPVDMQMSGCGGTDAGVDAGAETDMGVPEDSGTLADSGLDAGMTLDSSTADSGEAPPPRARPASGLCTASQRPAQGGGATGLAFLLGLFMLVARRRRTRLRTLALVATAVLALCGAPGNAGAQETSPSRESVARLHFQLGSALYEEGRFEQAAHEFELAYEASQRPQLLFNIYVAYRDAQLLDEALQSLRRYVDLAPESETALQRSRLASLEAQVAEMRRLRAGQGGSDPTVATDGSVATAPIRSEPLGTAAAPDAGDTDDSASSGGGRRVAGIALLGLGGAGVATFVGSLVGLRNADDRLDRYCGANAGLPANQCQDVPAVDAAESRMGTFRALGWVSLGVGVAAVAAGTTLLLLGRGDDATTASFGCDGSGCVGVVRGRF